MLTLAQEIVLMNRLRRAQRALIAGRLTGDAFDSILGRIQSEMLVAALHPRDRKPA